MPRTIGRQRTAFTLIELLAVIAIIAVLIGILLPALARGREASRSAVSLGNLKSLAQVQLVYANDHNQSFVNPFDAKNPQLWGRNWYEFVLQRSYNGGPLWYASTYGVPQYTTEAFGFVWASLATEYLTQTENMWSQTLLSPNDAVALQRRQFRLPLISPTLQVLQWDTSYWASPTLWLGPERYQFEARTPVGPASGKFWRRNRTDDATSPQSKVMLMERFDFSLHDRQAMSGGREKYSPMYNNPDSNTRFALVDGSVDQLKMKRLHNLTSGQGARQADIDVFKPSGDWDMPDSLLGDLNNMNEWGLSRDGLENGDGSVLGIPGGFRKFNALFWATRNGVHGRDIPR